MTNRNFRIHSVLVLSIFIFLFVLAACEKARTGYRFRGTLDPSDTGALYLVYDTFTMQAFPNPADTARLKGGYFEFSGAVPYPIPCLLTRENGERVALFMIENSDITLDTATNVFGRKVRGSKSQAEAEELQKVWYGNRNDDYTLDSLADLPGISEKTRDSLKSESKRVDSLENAAAYQRLFEYVRSHSSSYGALFGWQVYELWEEGSTAPARRIFEQFDPEVRNSPKGRERDNLIRYYESLQAGQPAPELNLVDIDAKIVSLSSFRGKQVVLFAQAYWDLKEKDMTALSKLTNAVVIAVSANKTWKKAKCLIVYEMEGLKSPYLPNTSEADPRVFIIDEDGKILAKGYEPWNDLK